MGRVAALRQVTCRVCAGGGVVGANLGAKDPNLTRQAVLAGLAGGGSLGETLRDPGLVE